MSLKAVLFDFNGVIINDEPIHEKLTEQILIEENLTLKPGEYKKICLGRSDRTCLKDLLASRGRVISQTQLTELLQRKALMYASELEKIEKLPLYAGLEDLIFQLRSRSIHLAVVSGAIRNEIELVLNRSKLAEYFQVIVAGDEITTSKPEPDGYLLAIERLNKQYPNLNLAPQECLVIEDSLAGIQAAKKAGIRVVGVAHTYPFHMLQRCCNWTVDYLNELELERVQEVFSPKLSE
ncbi:HAD family phosphatase [Aetokthonos hydrillicola Thurmond2011]|jgi:HAD superfamily hydrolase (TIGR01509 family)|uniref:HAD family phosphatase n=1 Tax=Aetokthonos hydrillicola Thurmond2011 TaxID=2712845 RepID=A0AAP5IG40_9CYAN|nr:HAD family phosphatase [Aetokthonos hydrillicola]MBO3464125.1 HAD family phosphatase [Aetokthonos hydrillicola CCALA 1050]MBW4590698.1 HAD family phosphatase [Aetokthonos hydrillicola CCALA 1050]MDR9899829.1 HAD family phosphatase [Aetokthonos hydrillicola Thurmond2011]